LRTPTYALTVDGITQPTTFRELVDALRALRDVLAAARLDEAQWQAHQYFLCARNGPNRVHDYLVAEGEFRLTFVADGVEREAVIRPR
jgi:hypothetical protein